MSPDELAIKYHNLIYSFASKHHVYLDIDDNYGMLAEAFWKACLEYNPNLGEFSTLAYKFMLNDLRAHIKSNTSMKRFNAKGSSVSINDEENINAINKVRNDGIEENIISDIDNQNLLNQLYEIASKTQRQYMLLALEGYKNTEIANMLNSTKQNVDNLKNRIKNKAIKNGYFYEVF